MGADSIQSRGGLTPQSESHLAKEARGEQRPPHAKEEEVRVSLTHAVGEGVRPLGRVQVQGLVQGGAGDALEGALSGHARAAGAVVRDLALQGERRTGWGGEARREGGG